MRSCLTATVATEKAQKGRGSAVAGVTRRMRPRRDGRFAPDEPLQDFDSGRGVGEGQEMGDEEKMSDEVII